MSARVRKWLTRSIELRITWGELLAVFLAVIIVTAIWPHTPTWAFILGGFVAGIAKSFAGDVRRWLRRRSTA